MDQPIFLPKGSATRKKNTMILHIMGLILMLFLILLLTSSFGILARSIVSSIVPPSAVGMDFTEVLSGGFAGAATYDPMDNPFMVLLKIWGVLGYIAAFVSLAAVIVLVILMKKRIDMILSDPTVESPVRVKKAAFVWLGFLLGAYGGHLFAMKKKKAWIYLGIGIVGTFFLPILFLYTSGISFADAFLACYIDKDADGYIIWEDYPYWL